MKNTLFFLCLIIGLNSFAKDEQNLRLLYVQAAENEEMCDSLILITANSELKDAPLHYGYHGAALMIKAKHKLNPINKLSVFTEGKALLEQAIAAYPENIELRILRYFVQKEAPRLLDYYGNLDEDYKLIFSSKKGENLYNSFK